MNNNVVDLVSSDDEEYKDIVPAPETTVTVTIAGPPLSMPRPTSIAWMAKGTMRKAVYNKKSKKLVEFRSQVKEQLVAMGHVTFPIYNQEAVAVDLKFYRKVAIKKLPSVKRQGDLPIFDVMKPDVDNLAKFVMDGLNGLVYKDDDQVVCLSAKKYLDRDPSNTGRTIIGFHKIGK
jgi:Holliday junction resolvase RusA-like endonuclease